MAHRIMSQVEQWAGERPKFVALCRNSSHVYNVYQLANQENWTVERFLEQCVLVLGQANAGLIKDFLTYRWENPPPVVVGDKRYEYVGPKNVDIPPLKSDTNSGSTT